MNPLETLAQQPRWVAWRNELRGGKPTKIPYAPNGKRAKSDDPATWGTRAEAEARAAKIVNGQGGGIGIEFGDLGDGRNLAGLDLDSCIGEDSKLAEWAAAVLKAAPTYAEISPSGRGLKTFFYMAAEDVRPFLTRIGVSSQGWGMRRDVPGEDARDHGPAVEMYAAGRYFTVTGQKWPEAPDELALLDHETLEQLATAIPPAPVRLSKSGGSNKSGGSASTKGGGDNSRSAAAFGKALSVRRANKSYDEMCAALRADPETADWCREKGDPNGERELKRIWRKVDAIVTSPPYQIDPIDPFRTARFYRELRHTRNGLPTLFRHRGDFYVWNGAAYPEFDPEELREKLYKFIADECVQVVFDKKKNEWVQIPVNPNRGLINNVVDGLCAASLLQQTIETPAWLDTRTDPNAADIIACGNGLLHLPTNQLLPHTPSFFTHNSLNFNFEPDPPAPAAWLSFLAQLWPNDVQPIEVLQEIFGYCLGVDTSQQKAFLLIGPKRSGKGTLARVLTAMVGSENTVAPTLAGLGTNFGLQPLIGKRVAIISDARLSGRADQAVIAERLLSITGEDGITIDRKYKDAWTGRLQTRFLILSNELPRLNDASGALASRFIVLVLTKSFFGHEDHGLTNKLLVELPGILNWAIEGWRRLRERGYFVQPASALEVVEELEGLGSPISAFLRDCCIMDPSQTVDPDTIYAAWTAWCSSQGREHPGTKQTFGRDLRAALPGLKMTQPREDGGRIRVYEGLGLKTRTKADEPPPEAILAHVSTFDGAGWGFASTKDGDVFLPTGVLNVVPSIGDAFWVLTKPPRQAGLKPVVTQAWSALA